MSDVVCLAPVQPWDAGSPAIHGPDLVGASAGKPFLYTIPATGQRPMNFGVQGLPQGLTIDSKMGWITGTVRADGTYRVLLEARNQHGSASKEFDIVIGQGLALTPPLGWNSWNAWRHWVSDAHIRSAADGLVKQGLAARGYTYVNVDSTWQGTRGGKYNAIQPNRKFPDMKALADYVHARGLKFGLYSTPWVTAWGCSDEEALAEWGGPPPIGSSSGALDPDYTPTKPDKFVGINKHEAADAAQWVEWGVDYLKYDWVPTDPKSVERMGSVLKAAPRDIVLSLCTNARLCHIEEYRKWAHLWRGTPDTRDTWNSLRTIAYMLEDGNHEDWRMHVRPGGWYDLDMFALGPQYESRDTTTPCKLTVDEQITHMTVWALFPSPLMLSCSLDQADDLTLRLICNEEVLRVNQDRLGKPAVRIREERVQTPQALLPHRESRIQAKALVDGSWAVGLFNLAGEADSISVSFADLGLTGSWRARNLWERRDLGRFEQSIKLPVPAHGAQMILLQR